MAAAAVDTVAKTVPNSERSRAMSFIFGGLHVGSIAGLLAAPPLIEHFGWPMVFLSFGAVGLLWVLWYEGLMANIQRESPEVSKALTPQKQPEGSGTQEKIPFRAILRSPPMRALAFTHFVNNWFHYTMLAWLPTYFTDALSLNLTDAAHVSLLPPIAAMVVSAIAGPSADALISRGVKVATVRKLAQCTAFLVPAVCLVAASMFQDSGAGLEVVVLLTLALGISSFSLAGLYCNHQDLSPKYASVLLGITNTVGSLPGIIGVPITGLLLDQTGSWSTALFAPSVVFFLIGSVLFVQHGRSDLQEFGNDSPFAWEGKLPFRSPLPPAEPLPQPQPQPEHQPEHQVGRPDSRPEQPSACSEEPPAAAAASCSSERGPRRKA